MKNIRATLVIGLLSMLIISLLLSGCAQKDLVSLAKLTGKDFTLEDRYGNTVNLLDAEEFLAAMKGAKIAPNPKDAKSEVLADYVLIMDGTRIYYDQDGKFLVYVGPNQKKTVYSADLDALLSKIDSLAPSVREGVDLVPDLSSIVSRISKIKEPAAAKFDLGDQTLLMVASGEKSTGGYTMELDDLSVGTDGSYIVTVRLKAPKEGDEVTTALTYPYLEVLFADTDLDLDVRLVTSTASGDKVEHVSLAQVKPGQNVILFKPERGALLTERVSMFGFASIFEGNFDIEVEDGHYILGRKNVQTEGAPKWGYFEFTMDVGQASSPHGMVIVSSTSSKDGSRIEELIVPVAFGGK